MEIYRYIPAKRVSTDEIGLYCISNDYFYTNAGTGTFIPGPEVHDQIPPELWADYIEYEYIESTGTQYIQTPWTCFQNSIIYAKAQLTEVTGTYSAIYGASGIPGQSNYTPVMECMVKNDASNNVLFGYENRTDLFGTVSNPLAVHEYYQNMNENYIDDILQSTYTGTGNFGLSYTLPIFAKNQNGTMQNYAKMKLYLFVIAEDSWTPPQPPTPTLNLYYDGNSVSNLYYNGQHVDHLVYNGNPVE